MSEAMPGSLSQRRVTADEVTQAVLASARYAALDPALVTQVAAQELGKGRRRKDAIKEVKSRLHQSVGAYWDSHANYAAWRAALESAPDDASQEVTLRSILRSHHSMRERLPFLPDFYSTLFAGLGPLRCVVDLGCGLAPLALPWMQLPADALYLACDVDREQVAFLAWWMAHYRQRGRAFVWNLLDGAPMLDRANFDTEMQSGDVQGQSPAAPSRGSELPCDPLRHCDFATDALPVDVALLLKLTPCLEQLERGVVQRLLDELTARVLIVSFPAQSLGGQRKGMPATYAAQMEAWLAGRPWLVERFEFPSELVFRLRREIV